MEQLTVNESKGCVCSRKRRYVRGCGVKCERPGNK